MGSFLVQSATSRAGKGLRLAILLALAAAASVAVVVSSASGATFPGTNGKLVYIAHKGNSYLATAPAVAGSTGTQITKPAATEQGDQQPRFSPDGTHVVFTRNPAQYGYNQLQLWISWANGVGAHQVTINGLPKGSYPAAPTFTPDGKDIVFEEDTINAPSGIWEVPVAGGTATRLTSGNDYQPTVSPDGTQIAFFRASSLVIADINGSNPQVLYTEAAPVTSADEPDFSPDGGEIAFMAYDSDAQTWDIWTVPSDGSLPAANLTGDFTSSSLDPAYSPDGTQIAFTSIDNNTSATTIDVMPVAGGSPTAVVTPPSGTIVYSADWGVKNQTPLPKKRHRHRRHHRRRHHHHHHH